MMSVAEALRMCKLRLDDIAGEESLQQAKILLGFALGIEESALPLHAQMELEREQIMELGGYLSRRAAGEPLQYILGQWSFMGLPFYVDRRALIPRQDTETLVEAALMLSKERGYRMALDLCCGCGCIGVSLAKLGELDVLAADLSAEALQLAAENAALSGVTLRFQRSDLFRDIRDEFDMIVCNPPYLSKADMASMQQELSFEPQAALYGGVDGLDFYRRIAGDYRPHLRRGGALLLEIGASQADAVTKLFYDARVLCDVSGQARVVIVDDGL